MNQVTKLVLGLAILLGSSVQAGTAEDQIAERLSKVGNLCLEGDACANAANTTTLVAAGSFNAE